MVAVRGGDLWVFLFIILVEFLTTLATPYDDAAAVKAHFVQWEKLIDQRIIRAHRFVNGLSGDWDWSIDDQDTRVTLACYARGDTSQKEANDILRKDAVFVDKLGGEVCYLVQLPPLTSPLADSSTAHVPAALKIDASIINHVRGISPGGTGRAPSSTHRALEEGRPLPNPLSLQVIFAPAILDAKTASELFERLNHTVGNLVSSAARKVRQEVWRAERVTFSAVQSLLHRLGVEVDAQFDPLESALWELSKPQCQVLFSPTITSDGFEVSDISGIDPSCLLSTAIAIAGSGAVLSLSVVPTPTLMNYEARGHLQCGSGDGEPFRVAGLTGVGQVVGIADSGLDDTSCFFADDSGAYPSVSTSRDGVVEPFRRKVIQYAAYADAVDEQGGHGTHVSGSVAGSSSGDFGQMDGVAPDAKISFFDIGLTDKALLKVPALMGLLDTAYRAGARVHTNSWGNNGGLYGPMSRDVDKFTCAHDDMLILFAGGNSGEFGRRTIISPGNAKNALTVGAGQLRSVFADNPLPDGGMNVALFSSIGPTFDNRIKPDVIAPGDFIMSAYASPPANQTVARSPTWHGRDHCAVHQMSGTSMATPLTAGAALLMRQYFMDRRFWSALCPQDLSTCRGGAFTPSGFLLKTMFLHSGRGMRRYSDPDYDVDGSAFRSFELGAPPDAFQGYGEVVLRNVLPLENGEGLDPSLRLYVWDRVVIEHDSALEFVVTIDKKGLTSEEEADGGVRWKSRLPLKVTLCWYDPPHSVGFMSKLLLHDLDLVIATPSQGIFLGNQRNVSFSLQDIAQQKVVPDDRNPNEQVFIASPLCEFALDAHGKEDHCTFRVLVQSYELPVHARQTFSLVITTNGSVSEPQAAERLFSFNNRQVVAEPAVLVSSVDLSARLSAGEVVNTSTFVDHCAMLSSVRVTVDFRSDAALDSWPYNLELTVVDPLGRGVAIGGVDLSLGVAAASTEWPDRWMHHRNGTFSAHLSATGAGLAGEGLWTVFLMNAWSEAGSAIFAVTVDLEYDAATWGNGTACSLLSSPSPRPTVASVEEVDFVRNESLQDLTSKTAFFTNVLLGVEDDGRGHDVARIAAFDQEGLLDSIVLSLISHDMNATMRGSSAWLLDVIVTAPNGLVAQVGGLDWLSVDDRFYARRWPDPWIGRSSALSWLSRRDVHAAGLTSLPLLAPLPPLEGVHNHRVNCAGWTVDLAMGYPYGERAPVKYTGSVTLLFRPIFFAPEPRPAPFSEALSAGSLLVVVAGAGLLLLLSIRSARLVQMDSKKQAADVDWLAPAGDEERQPLTNYGAL